MFSFILTKTDLTSISIVVSWFQLTLYQSIRLRKTSTSLCLHSDIILKTEQHENVELELCSLATLENNLIISTEAECMDILAQQF